MPGELTNWLPPSAVKASTITTMHGGAWPLANRASISSGKLGRKGERLLDPPEHVQVGDRRLDHHHVGTLGHVERDLPDGLLGVGRVHLVAGAVAEAGRALGRLPERA